MADSAKTSKPTKSMRKGALVKVNRQAYIASEALQASDNAPPTYIFEGPGEVLSIKGDYAQIRWRLPVPDVWLRIDQLEAWD